MNAHVLAAFAVGVTAVLLINPWVLLLDRRTSGRSEGDGTLKRTAQALTTTRQEALLRVVKQMFSDFHQRQAHYYLGNGASTSHIIVHVIQDFETLRIFWPEELVSSKVFGGTTYGLESDTLYRVQQRVRDVLKQLEAKGHLEKIGNTDERRWKPTYAEVA